MKYFNLFIFDPFHATRLYNPLKTYKKRPGEMEKTHIHKYQIHYTVLTIAAQISKLFDLFRDSAKMFIFLNLFFTWNLREVIHLYLT